MLKIVIRMAVFQTLVALVISSAVGQTQSYKYKVPVQTKDGIKVGTLSKAGLAAPGIKDATNQLLAGDYGNVHSFLLIRDGVLVHEQYFKGEDFQRGKGRLGVVEHGPDTLHDMRSVTKTFVAVAILLAHSRGKIKTLDASIFEYLPEHRSFAESQKNEITIKHLLTMAAGQEWNEQMSYTNPANDETRMDAAPDPVAYFLGKPSVHKPGSTFNYSGGATETLAAIVKSATGKPAEAYLAEELFKPLGISSFEWAKRANGMTIYPSGLRLRSRDLAKFGIFFLNRGKWNNKQIVRPDLIDQAVQPQIVTPIPIPNGGSVAYGYHLWRPTLPAGPNELMTWVMAEGNGGQIMALDIDRGFVTVMTAGAYNNRQGKSSDNFYQEVVYPILKNSTRPRP